MTHTTKHTPGPWHLEYDVDGIPLTIIGADNSAIGIVETWNAHTEGNRHLLTAAPAMYEALRQAYAYLAEMGCDCEEGQSCGDCIVCQCEAALAQAEGAQHE